MRSSASSFVQEIRHGIKSLVPLTGKMISKSDSLILNFGQNQPAIVPASSAARVSNDLPFGLV